MTFILKRLQVSTKKVRQREKRRVFDVKDQRTNQSPAKPHHFLETVRTFRAQLWEDERRDWEQTGPLEETSWCYWSLQQAAWGRSQRAVSSWWEGPRGRYQRGLFLACSVATLVIVSMLS